MRERRLHAQQRVWWRHGRHGRWNLERRGTNAGGGTAAGGVGGTTGTIDQELVSGTRLRAMNVVGDDGSKSPFGNVFWDTQLNACCAPTVNPTSGGLRGGCWPLRAVTPLGSTGFIFADSNCSQPAAYWLGSDLGDVFVDAGLGAGGLFIDDTDGGLFQATNPTAVFVRHYYDGGCAPTDGKAYTPGAPVSPASLVPMRLVRD